MAVKTSHRFASGLAKNALFDGHLENWITPKAYKPRN